MRQLVLLALLGAAVLASAKQAPMVPDEAPPADVLRAHYAIDALSVGSPGEAPEIHVRNAITALHKLEVGAARVSLRFCGRLTVLCLARLRNTRSHTTRRRRKLRLPSWRPPSPTRTVSTRLWCVRPLSPLCRPRAATASVVAEQRRVGHGCVGLHSSGPASDARGECVFVRTWGCACSGDGTGWAIVVCFCSLLRLSVQVVNSIAREKVGPITSMPSSPKNVLWRLRKQIENLRGP